MCRFTWLFSRKGLPLLRKTNNIAYMCTLSPNAHSAEEMKSVVAQRIREMEAGTASYIDGEEGFATIRARYGFCI